MAQKKKLIHKETVDWMKHHTVEDAKDLVVEISSEGEDVTEIVDIVNELEKMAHKLEKKAQSA